MSFSTWHFPDLRGCNYNFLLCTYFFLSEEVCFTVENSKFELISPRSFSRFKSATECVTDLDKLSELIFWGSISTTFELNSIFEAARAVSYHHREIWPAQICETLCARSYTHLQRSRVHCQPLVLPMSNPLQLQTQISKHRFHVKHFTPQAYHVCI